MNKTVLAGAALLSLAGSMPAKAVPADFRAKADAYLKSVFPAGGPGAAVIVTDDGKTVYSGARGLADVKTKTPITPATVFRMGSITKQFSSAVMLQLVAEGKVSLDDKLSKYLPDFPKPGADATIAQLLNHTVGVQSYTNIPGWMADEKNTDRAYSTEQMIALFKDLPSPSKPGEEFSYNNSGYVLVGAVIEKVTGKAWHEAIDERVVKPLGLKTVRYGVYEAATPRMAKGYTRGEKEVEPARKLHMSVPHAAGALIGSVEDLAKWSQALHHGKVVPAALYARMIAPTRLPGGKVEDFGFGIGPRKVRGHPAIGHGGGIFGFSTDSIYIPQDDIFVAVFTNSDQPAADPGAVMQRLAALAVGDPYPTFEKAAIDLKSLEPLFGVYAIDGGERRFYARDGKLFTRRTGAPDLEAFAAGNDRFFYGRDALTWFEIRRDPAGKHVMAMHQEGASDAELAVRSGPVPADPKPVELPRSTLERYVGSYKAAFGVAVVAFAGDALTFKLGGQREVVLRAVGPTEFLVEGVDAQISFKSDGGKATGLVLKQGPNQISAERVAD